MSTAVRIHSCSACGFVGESERELMQHFRGSHYTPLGSRSINRVQCRRCRRTFVSEYNCLQHEVQAHRDTVPRRRLTDAEALEIRRSIPNGPADPTVVADWSARLGVSKEYVWAVVLGLAHLHQDALLPGSELNDELDLRYRLTDRKRSVRRTTTRVSKDELANEQNPGDSELSCGYCGVGISISDATKDHKTPVNLGGGNELNNLHLVCRPCNRLKSDYTDAEFRLVLDLARVYCERAEGLVGRVARRLADLSDYGERDASGA